LIAKRLLPGIRFLNARGGPNADNLVGAGIFRGHNQSPETLGESNTQEMEKQFACRWNPRDLAAFHVRNGPK
jgi:hypothetical protein